ncbi:MAG: nucleotide exchange factor GrpE [Acidobacteriaceae bacterium]|jgi:molecular chaperone GrpE|nr:nucleotide exchange factor GrpE [Acidobacteriaceae bacterium]
MKNHVHDDQEVLNEEVLNPADIVGAPEAAATQPSELESVKAERDQLFDRLARLQAEFDNARKRAAKESAEFREYAIAGAVDQFLPVIDNFHLALAHGGTIEQLRSGVELIVKQMEDALRSLGVQPVETVGTQFDPHQHEAIEFVETTEHPDHQVLEEVRRGYRIKERLLRPALVKVANNTATQDA